MILVTGASGFVGRALTGECRARRIDFRGAVRGNAAGGEVEVGDIDADTDWSAALRDVDCVVHAAARVHVMRDAAEDPLALYRTVNVDGTLNLARRSAAAGVKRFVFLSSIKVNGEATLPGCPFTAADDPRPVDDYAISKLEAERGLRELSADSGLEVVVIRSPLVYGPGVKGNFARLLDWLDRGMPLPFGAVDNRRSLVALDNLVDLVLTCTDHPAAADQTWLVSDGEDLSTPELLRRLGKALGKRARLLPVPPSLLKIVATVAGRGDDAGRLLGSLQVDSASTRERLGWNPPVSVDEGLQRVARNFLSRHR